MDQKLVDFTLVETIHMLWFLKMKQLAIFSYLFTRVFPPVGLGNEIHSVY